MLTDGHPHHPHQMTVLPSAEVLTSWRNNVAGSHVWAWWVSVSFRWTAWGHGRAWWPR